MQESPLGVGHAPGKIILFGEHAVVYGRPAIAVPLTQVQAHAEVFPHSRCVVEAVDLGRRVDVAEATADDPFALVVRLTCAAAARELPPWRIVVHSEIPIASGLGSGAAISAAIARALLDAWDVLLSPAELSRLVYEVEKLHHGTPSGIDNTVVVYATPVWFVKGAEPEPFHIGSPMHFLIADTGVASPTRLTVSAVRAAWEQNRARYEALFDRIGAVATAAREAIEQGDVRQLGSLMDRNQALLAELQVSSPELDRLCRAAREAGALGAKLSGGGRGGNMIALVEPVAVERVAHTLRRAGAVRVLSTLLGDR
ncbi:MAG: mevalonate kinase [Caldilineae bacterium]|nr:MAG: mevalonate kinase [Caldilineae bacterium]